MDNGPAPAQGSFARYRTEDVRVSLGASAEVTAVMKGYHQKVNDENRRAFANLKPPPVAKGEASCVGVDACVDCHSDAKAVWDRTAHAHAYKTLSVQSRELNLDCVSCHVTGYAGARLPLLRSSRMCSVKCVHGPGSNHTKAPKTAMPVPSQCLSCHHPPHVHSFDPATKMEAILGPGHGRGK
jgi:hypothetical protein